MELCLEYSRVGVPVENEVDEHESSARAWQTIRSDSSESVKDVVLTHVFIR